MRARKGTARSAAKAQLAAASPAELRALTSELLARSDFATLAGRTFRGRRDAYASLGYKQGLQPKDYRDRYNRGGIAKRLVEAFPNSTWRGGGEVVENDNPDVETAFEKAFFELNQRLGVWSAFLKTDILAGLGRFAVILLGAPGKYEDPLEKCGPEDLKYLAHYSERDITISEYVTDPEDERFAQPKFYGLRLRTPNGQVNVNATRIHYSRIIHVAEGKLDDPVMGTPRLQAVWNYLDDLDKVVGGGAEASWKRIDGGKQFDLDASMPMPDAADLAALKEKIDLYTNDLERVLTTRGVKINDLGSNVSVFNANADCVIGLISATTGIPQRILMGSERGELASSTDQSNYDDRVEDRRHDFASTELVRPFIDRMIELGVLPKPAQYEARWPETDSLDDDGRMALADKAAGVNQKMGETVVTPNEIRDRILGWPPLEELEWQDDLDVSVEDDPDAEVDPADAAAQKKKDDAEAVRKAARSKVKRVRLLRLTAKGRRELKRMAA